VGIMSGEPPNFISAAEQHTFVSARALEGISKLTWHGIRKAAHVSLPSIARCKQLYAHANDMSGTCFRGLHRACSQGYNIPQASSPQLCTPLR